MCCARCKIRPSKITETKRGQMILTHETIPNRTSIRVVPFSRRRQLEEGGEERFDHQCAQGILAQVRMCLRAGSIYETRPKRTRQERRRARACWPSLEGTKANGVWGDGGERVGVGAELKGDTKCNDMGAKMEQSWHTTSERETYQIAQLNRRSGRHRWFVVTKRAR